MKRSEFLDFAKGSLIVLVCVGHALQFLVYQNQGFWGDPLFKSIYMFHMPLFMAISGYVSFRGVAATPLSRLLGSKATTYLIPIFMWALLSQLVLAGLYGGRSWVSFPKDVVVEAVRSLWFIWALFGSLVLVGISNLFGRLSPVASILSFVLLCMVPDKGNLHLLKYTYPYFLLGYYAARGGWKADSWQRKLLVGLAGVGSVLCYVLWTENTYIYVTGMALVPENFGNIALRYVAGMVVSCFALGLFYYAYTQCMPALRKAVIVLGKDSLYIYIISGYAFTSLLELSRAYVEPPSSRMQAGVAGLALGLVIAILSLCIGRILALNPLLARLLFGRIKKAQKSQVQELEPALRS